MQLTAAWRTVFAHPGRYSHIIRYLKWTLEDLLDHLRFPIDLRMILAGQSAIFWAPPRDLSLVVQAGGVGSYDQGAYYPTNSFMHVMKSLLRKIKERSDCRSMLSTEITAIEISGGGARSVTTAKGQRFTADQFLFDGDAALSLALIDQQHIPKAFRKKLKYDYGTSVLSVYLGLKDIDLRRYGFGEQNLFWHPKIDLNEVYDDQLSNRIPDRPYFFCNAPTLRPHHAVLAPPGCDQLVMVAPCSYDFFRKLRAHREQDYQAAKQQYCDFAAKVFSRARRATFQTRHPHLARRSTRIGYGSSCWTAECLEAFSSSGGDVIGVAVLSKSRVELYESALATIRHARDATASLLANGFIPTPPGRPSS